VYVLTVEVDVKKRGRPFCFGWLVFTSRFVFGRGIYQIKQRTKRTMLRDRRRTLNLATRSKFKPHCCQPE
jgi:hypothetical protein